MNIDIKFFEIDEVKIEWGKPLHEVRPMLEHFEKYKPFDGWANVRGKCSSIFGLPTTEFEVRAPFEDRPVLQVHFEIAPIKTEIFKKLHAPYMKQLEQTLGKPFKSESLYIQADLKNEYSSSTVVFTAKWLFSDIRISLSVYGATRNKDSGPSAAGIFIDWIDEIKASKPFRDKSENFEITISEHITADIVLMKFKLQHKQSPFSVIHYELDDPYIAEKDDKLRTSQISLYKRDMYLTPSLISSKLQDDEIGYYKVYDLDKIFISNKWDTIYLNTKCKNEMTYWEILPSRGPGVRELDLKELKIEDTNNSDKILELVKQIETDLGQKIERKEIYNE